VGARAGAAEFRQAVRPELAALTGVGSSNTPPPPLPEDVAAATRARYVEAYERLTGRRFVDWLGAPG
jgi:phosphoribosylaminoimidazole-succinocarboxamide synthase